VCLFGGMTVGPLGVGLVAAIGDDDLTGLRWGFALCGLVNLLTALLARVALPPVGAEERPRLGLPPRAVVQGRRTRMALVTSGLGFAVRGVLGLTLLPLLGDSLGEDAFVISAALVLMSLSELAAMVAAGRLADRLGRRPVLCWASALGAGLALWAVARPPGILFFVLCGASGVVSAGLRVAPTAMLADVAPSPEVAAIGWRLASDVGLVATSALLGATLGWLGLAGTFACAALLTAAVGVIGYLNGETLPRSRA
jgi:MFS family permease